MTDEEQQQVDEFTRQRNVASIKEVPATHITEEMREALIKRASVPEDVYAYGSVDSPTGIINLWDTDTRIPFFPLSQYQWKLIGRTAMSSYVWELRFSHLTIAQPDVTITINIDPLISEGDIGKYWLRVPRVAMMIEHYIALYGDHPQAYHLRRF